MVIYNINDNMYDLQTIQEQVTDLQQEHQTYEKLDFMSFLYYLKAPRRVTLISFDVLPI